MSFFYQNRQEQLYLYLSKNNPYAVHLHRQLELIYVLSGSTTVTVEQQDFLLTPGQGVLVFPNQMHGLKHVEPGHKIKREKDNLTLQLKPTQDIAAALGNRKKDGQTLVGFALETNDETKNAQRKLERKNLDFIVLNSLNDQGAGFRCDTNKITIIDRQGATPYPLKSKQEVARDIIDRLVNNK